MYWRGQGDKELGDNEVIDLGHEVRVMRKQLHTESSPAQALELEFGELGAKLRDRREDRGSDGKGDSLIAKRDGIGIGVSYMVRLVIALCPPLI